MRTGLVRLGAGGLFFLFLFALSFSRAMSKGVSHDEYQFVASAQLLASRGLLPYVDYPFLHMPYMAFVNAPFVLLTGYDFLAVRGFSAFCGFLSAALIFYAAYRAFSPSRAVILAALFALFYAANPTFAGTDGLALNHSFPLLLSAGSWLLYHEGSRRSRPETGLFLSGVLAGLATGSRLSFAVLLLPYLSAALIAPCGQAAAVRVRRAAAFGLGAALALLPAGVLFLMAPKPFYYGNFVYTRLNTVYRQMLGHDFTMTLGSKWLYFVQEVLAAPGNLILYLGVSMLSLAALARWVRTKDRASYEVVFLFVLALVLLAGAFAPTPLWPQYFLAPLPFLVMGLILGITGMTPPRPYRDGLLAGSLLVLAALAVGKNPVVLGSLAVLRQPQAWQPVLVHRFSENLRALVPGGKVLTLAPIIPLESGLDTYAMFATGPFAWRTAHILSAEKRREYGVISYTELEAFLEQGRRDQQGPPQAILIGLERHNDGFERADTGGLEKPLIDYARENGYIPLGIQAEFADLETYVWVRDRGIGEITISPIPYSPTLLSPPAGCASKPPPARSPGSAC